MYRVGIELDHGFAGFTQLCKDGQDDRRRRLEKVVPAKTPTGHTAKFTHTSRSGVKLRASSFDIDVLDLGGTPHCPRPLSPSFSLGLGRLLVAHSRDGPYDHNERRGSVNEEIDARACVPALLGFQSVRRLLEPLAPRRGLAAWGRKERVEVVVLLLFAARPELVAFVEYRAARAVGAVVLLVFIHVPDTGPANESARAGATD